MPRLSLLYTLALVVACSSADEEANVAPAPEPSAERSGPEPVQPTEPTRPALVAEAPIDDTSAEGAAQVVQSYFALIEQRRYREAWRLWANRGQANGLTEDEFAASFARYGEYHAQIGALGRVEGAAGSLFVEVPVQVYGRLIGGERFSRNGSVTLRRANEVPGATAEQRRWRIFRSEVEPG